MFFVGDDDEPSGVKSGDSVVETTRGERQYDINGEVRLYEM